MKQGLLTRLGILKKKARPIKNIEDKLSYILLFDMKSFMAMQGFTEFDKTVGEESGLIHTLVFKDPINNYHAHYNMAHDQMVLIHNDPERHLSISILLCKFYAGEMLSLQPELNKFEKIKEIYE